MASTPTVGGWDRKTFTRRCPSCGRLLGTAILEVERTVIDGQEIRSVMAGVHIRFGNRTKCHRCKRIDEHLAVA